MTDNPVASIAQASIPDDMDAVNLELVEIVRRCFDEAKRSDPSLTVRDFLKKINCPRYIYIAKGTSQRYWEDPDKSGLTDPDQVDRKISRLDMLALLAPKSMGKSLTRAQALIKRLPMNQGGRIAESAETQDDFRVAFKSFNKKLETLGIDLSVALNITEQIENIITARAIAKRPKREWWLEASIARPDDNEKTISRLDVIKRLSNAHPDIPEGARLVELINALPVRKKILMKQPKNDTFGHDLYVLLKAQGISISESEKVLKTNKAYGIITNRRVLVQDFWLDVDPKGPRDDAGKPISRIDALMLRYPDACATIIDEEQGLTVLDSMKARLAKAPKSRQQLRLRGRNSFPIKGNRLLQWKRAVRSFARSCESPLEGLPSIPGVEDNDEAWKGIRRASKEVSPQTYRAAVQALCTKLGDISEGPVRTQLIEKGKALFRQASPTDPN